MPDTVAELLRNAAGEPSATPDFGDLWQRGRRRRRASRLAVATAGLAVLVGVVAGSATVLSDADGAAVVFEPGGPSAGSPEPRSGHTQPVVRLADGDYRVLAAAATDDASLKGHVVRGSQGLAGVWRMADVAGDPPELPSGHVGVIVIARVARSTCRSVDDVVGVRIVRQVVVVEVDADGAFVQPCPGPPGAHAWTSFVVALPEKYDEAGLTGAKVRPVDARKVVTAAGVTFSVPKQWPVYGDDDADEYREHRCELGQIGPAVFLAHELPDPQRYCPLVKIGDAAGIQVTTVEIAESLDLYSVWLDEESRTTTFATDTGPQPVTEWEADERGPEGWRLLRFDNLGVFVLVHPYDQAKAMDRVLQSFQSSTDD